MENLKSSLKFKIFIFIITVLLIVLMFPRGESLESEVTVGSIWIQEDLIASISFPVKKGEEQYKKELKQAANAVHPVFVKEENIDQKVTDSLKSYNKYLKEVIDSNLTHGNQEFEIPTFLSTESYNVFKTQRMKRQELGGTGNAYSLDALFSISERNLRKIYNTGMLNINYEELEKDSIALRNGNVDVIIPKETFFDRSSGKQRLKTLIAQSNLPEYIVNALYEYTVHFLEPNIRYNENLTQEEIEAAQSKVSRYSGIINENERIVAKHDKITPEIKQIIDSYKAAKGEATDTTDIILQFTGKFLHIFSLLMLLGIYLYMFRKKIYEDNFKILIFVIIFLSISYITYLINQITGVDSIHLLVIIPAASMLFTILFDSRVGFYSTIILALICAALRGNDYVFATMNIIAGTLAVYTVRDIKNRNQIFRSFIFIFIGYTTAILMFGFERYAPWSKMFMDLIFGTSNALISPVFTYGLLIFFERFFNITTDLTLLELSNFDRPLLRELARKAPGTFSHSVTMGTIAESAAETINGNPLLARVGAYYHDIGKVIDPQYFVENQMNNKNLHNEMKPEESVKVIRNHVKAGIELAKDYKLPQEIIDFIPMHHGTSVIFFFYDKAKKKYGEENVNLDDYRYPGPKPDNRETAIIHLADSCESAVRSISEPDHEKIENLINNLIDTKIKDGQLDNSTLTFRDISKIKSTFTSILLGQAHSRIRYPKQDKMEKEEK